MALILIVLEANKEGLGQMLVNHALFLYLNCNQVPQSYFTLKSWA